MEIQNEGYRQFSTPTQWKYYEALCEHGTSRKAGEAMGVSHSTINKTIRAMKKKAALKNFDPENGSFRVVPEGFEVKGTSTMTRNEFGEIQWVKTRQELVDLEEKIRTAVEILCDEARGKIVHDPLDASVLNTIDYEKLSVYPITDIHVGMLAWGQECGEDQDLKIIQDIVHDGVDGVIRSQPNSAEAIVAFMGDYFHSDDDDNETRASGNRLDCDGRIDKSFDIGIRLARDIIAKVASKHEMVRVIVLPGNHDEYLSMAMKYVLSAVYENDERIHLEMTHGSFAYHEFGATLLAFHHGHTVKPDRMAGVIAEDMREAWGRVNMVHALTGHIHHQSVKDTGTCKVESFRTVCAKDSYAASHGYRAVRTMYSIAYDRDNGECARSQYNIIQPEVD